MSTLAKELTVVVTSHRRPELIGETLERLAEQTWDGDWDVVIVDNLSDDETLDVIESWLPRFPVPARLVLADERPGASYSRNYAVSFTNARSVAFVDDDDHVGDGWLAALGTALREQPLVASRMSYDRLNSPALAETTHFQTERIGRHFDVPILDSAGSGWDRELWLSVGGMDERCGGVEDTDIALRVARDTSVRPHFCDDALYNARLRSSFSGALRRGLGRGKGEVLLYQLHGDTFGVQAEPTWQTAGRWFRLLVRLPWLTSDRRMVWAEDLGRRIGRVHACVERRVWFL